MKTSTVALCLLLLLGGAAASAPAPAPATDDAILVGGYGDVDASQEPDAEQAVALVKQELAKTYPNDEIEVISVESQVVAGTNWRVEVEVQASEPVAYTAVVFQALPFAGGNFTLTSLTRM